MEKQLLCVLKNKIFNTNYADNFKALDITFENYLNNEYKAKYLLKYIDDFLNRDFNKFIQATIEYTGIKELEKLDIQQFICKAINIKSYDKNNSPLEDIFTHLIHGQAGEIVVENFIKKQNCKLLNNNNYLLPQADYDLLVQNNNNAPYKIEVKNYSLSHLRLDKNEKGTSALRVKLGTSQCNWDLLYMCSYTTKGLRPIYIIKGNSIDPITTKNYLMPSIKSWDDGYTIANMRRIFLVDLNDKLIEFDNNLEYFENSNIIKTNYNYLDLCDMIDYNKQQQIPNISQF